MMSANSYSESEKAAARKVGGRRKKTEYELDEMWREIAEAQKDGLGLGKEGREDEPLTAASRALHDA